MKKYSASLALCPLLLAAGSAHAVIIGGAVTSGTGSFIELSLPFDPPNGAPNAVGDDTFQTPNLYAFNEDQNIVIGSPLDVDVLAATGSAGSLATNTVVASHYVFFDPEPVTTQIGFVDFDADILALITSTTLLGDSDFLLNNNVTYLNPGFRGLEPGDSATIDPDHANRVVVNWTAVTPGDFIRVLTAKSVGGEDPCSTNPPGVGGCPADDVTTVPEPSGLTLLALGLLGLGALRRRALA